MKLTPQLLKYFCSYCFWIADLHIEMDRNLGWTKILFGLFYNILVLANPILIFFLKFVFDTKSRGIRGIRRQATDWEKIFAKVTSDKRLLSKMYKELLKHNIKKWTIQLKNDQNEIWINTSPKQYPDMMVNKYRKSHSIWHVIRKLQVKTTR